MSPAVDVATLRAAFGRHHVAVTTMDAADFGVPQTRRRLFVVCDRLRLERGTRRERIMLLGNAVCPPVMQAIVAGLVADQSTASPTVAAA